VRVGQGAAGDATPYGFQVPTGDPSELDAAASQSSSWAAALTGRAGAVRAGAASASAGWSGPAEGGFASYAGHVEHIYGTLGDTVAAASRTLSRFAGELEAAQMITARALAECESTSAQVTSAQTEAAAHADRIQSLNTDLLAAAHPAQHAEISRQIGEAQGSHQAALDAASRAQSALEAAEYRGRQAWSTYQQQAQSASQTLQGLTAQIVKVEGLPAGARPGTNSSSSFFWPTLGGAIGAPETGAGIGLAEGLLKRYRNTELVLPITEDARGEMETFATALGPEADPFVASASGLLLVPTGSSADPMIQELQQATSTNQYTQPNRGVLVPGEDDIEAAAPEWSSVAGRSLGFAGVGLTLWSTGAGQWQYDSEHHPGWSTTSKVIDSAQTAAVEGGSEAGGAWIGAAQGAETGAEGGFAIGEMIDPLGGGVVGGVIGGIGGGIVGGLAGGEAGKVIGDTAESAGHAIVHVAGDVGGGVAHAASDVWNAVF